MTGGNCGVCKVVGVLVGLGALNWGLAGVFGLDLVAAVLGAGTGLAKVAYGVIGLAGIMKLVSIFKCCPCCKPAAGGGSCGSK
ncbi:MAG: DUF378 domain-containing protein [Candidatus Omnitrophica bacterium]|nr:DUF378 domain-containing protein [Candidatus Omnitrophota bacterium]